MKKKRTHKNKGISPLIATVLIIGFTLLIGSMVMIWGTDIFKKYQTESGEKAMTQLTCTTKVDLNIKEACDLGTSIRVKVENQADQTIESIIYRAISPSGAAIDTYDQSLSPFEIKTFSVNYFAVDSFYTKPTKIELLPRVLIDGKEKTCSGVSKEIKPCYTLPSLNSLNSWTISTSSSKGLLVDIKENLEELEETFEDETGIYAHTCTFYLLSCTQEEITINSESFVIPQEASALFVRYLAFGKTDSITGKVFINEIEEYTQNDAKPVNTGGITIGYKILLAPEDKGKTARLEFKKSDGGLLAVTNLGYIIE